MQEEAKSKIQAQTLQAESSSDDEFDFRDMESSMANAFGLLEEKRPKVKRERRFDFVL